MLERVTARRLVAIVQTFVLATAAITLTVVSAVDTVDASTAAESSVIDANSSHACAVLAEGTVQCWGSNGYGQLGRGTTGSGDANAADVIGLDDATQVGVGSSHVCALHATGTVSCWGDGYYGQLGNGLTGSPAGSTTTPVAVPGLSDVEQLAVGRYFNCALIEGGAVTCWGDNGNGQLGRDTAGVDDGTPTPIPMLTTATEIATAVSHACAVLTDTSVRCWGSNTEGALGDGNTGIDSAQPVAVSALTTAVHVDVGFLYSCAILADTTVRCWGQNNSGQLGDGTTTDSDVPVISVGVSDAVEIGLMQSATCVVRSTGDRMCWGANAVGQLGNGSLANETTPVVVAQPSNLRALSGASRTMCAVTTDDAAYCWGDNKSGQANGTGLLTNPSPIQLSTIQPLSLRGDDNNVCGLTPTDRITCTGDNSYDQLLNGLGLPASSFTPVSGLTNVFEVALGERHACALRFSGDVACWGADDQGQHGEGPGFVSGQLSSTSISLAADIDSGALHTCAIVDNGALDEAVQCWGANTFGQIGDGTTTRADEPAIVTRTWTSPTSLSAGENHTCAVDNGEIWCWGKGIDGQLGDGLSTDSSTPVQVDGITTAVEVAAGDRHTCAITGTGDVECWGFTNYSGPTSNTSTPSPISITTAVQLAISDRHTCARLADGTVECWGADTSGRVGNGEPTGTTELDPVPVVEVVGATAISDGDQTCAVTASEVLCWGQNDNGEFSSPPYLWNPEPVALGNDVYTSTTTSSTTTSSTTTSSTTTTTTTTTVPGGTTTTTVPGGTTTTTGPSGTTTTTVPNSPLPPTELFSPVGPARLVETRSTPGTATVDGQQYGIGRQLPGAAVTVDVAGRAGVPNDAAAAVINVTAIRPDGTGYITAHPCLATAPITSSLNFAAFTTVGNEVITELDASGNACLFVSAETDLTVDIVAFLPAGSDYTAVPPARLADTRPAPAAVTIDGGFESDGRLTPGSTHSVEVAGRAGVPSGATAAVLNVTAIGAAETGYFTVHPCLSSAPNAASLNFTPASNRGNEIIAPLSATGDVCVFSSAEADLAIDVVGHISSTAYSAITPSRLLETRSGTGLGTADGDDSAIGRRGAGETLTLDVAGRIGIPPTASTVTINVTAVGAEGTGYATVHPCLPAPPNAASLNFVAGVNGGNEIVAELDANGQVCIFVSASTHLTVDISGFTT